MTQRSPRILARMRARRRRAHKKAVWRRYTGRVRDILLERIFHESPFRKALFGDSPLMHAFDEPLFPHVEHEPLPDWEERKQLAWDRERMERGELLSDGHTNILAEGVEHVQEGDVVIFIDANGREVGRCLERFVVEHMADAVEFLHDD